MGWRMRAGELLNIYRRRQVGYEEGFLKYDGALYQTVCSLVHHLAQLPSDELVRIEMNAGCAVLSCIRTGHELARISVDDTSDNSRGDAG